MELPRAPEEIVAMPLQELALAVLAQLVRASQVNRMNFIRQVYASMTPQPGVSAGHRGRSINREPEAARALSEAWDWLVVRGLLSSDPLQDRSFYFVTRRGLRVAADPSALDEEW